MYSLLEESHVLTSEQCLSIAERAQDPRVERKLSGIISVSIRADDTPELHTFSVSMFASLVELRLDGCPPSTVKDMYDLRVQLKSLVMVNCGIFAIDDVFRPPPSVCDDMKFLSTLPPMIPSFNSAVDSGAHNEGDESKKVMGFRELEEQEELAAAVGWLQLSSLSLSNCGIRRMDYSFHLTPRLTHLDLSHNRITRIQHLQRCSYLLSVNLSYNRVSNLDNSDRIMGSIVKLDLSHNAIECVSGVERLFALQRLNLSHNRIAGWRQVDLLTNLPNLAALHLEGNPLAMQISYRVAVFRRFLRDPSQLHSSSRSLRGDGGSGRGIEGVISGLPVLDGRSALATEVQELESCYFEPADGEVPRRYSRQLSEEDEDVSEVYTEELRRAALAQMAVAPFPSSDVATPEGSRGATEGHTSPQDAATSSGEGGLELKSTFTPALVLPSPSPSFPRAPSPSPRSSLPTGAEAEGGAGPETPLSPALTFATARAPDSVASSTSSMLWSPRCAAAPRRHAEIYESKSALDVSMGQPSSRDVVAMLSVLEDRWLQRKRERQHPSQEMSSSSHTRRLTDALIAEETEFGEQSQRQLRLQYGTMRQDSGDGSGGASASWMDWTSRTGQDEGKSAEGRLSTGSSASGRPSGDCHAQAYDRWDDSLQSLDSLQDEKFLRELRQAVEESDAAAAEGGSENDEDGTGTSGRAAIAEHRDTAHGRDRLHYGSNSARTISQATESSDEMLGPRIDVDSPVQLPTSRIASFDSVGGPVRLMETLPEEDDDETDSPMAVIQPESTRGDKAVHSEIELLGGERGARGNDAADNEEDSCGSDHQGELVQSELSTSPPPPLPPLSPSQLPSPMDTHLAAAAAATTTTTTTTTTDDDDDDDDGENSSPEPLRDSLDRRSLAPPAPLSPMAASKASHGHPPVLPGAGSGTPRRDSAGGAADKKKKRFQFPRWGGSEEGKGTSVYVGEGAGAGEGAGEGEGEHKERGETSRASTKDMVGSAFVRKYVGSSKLADAVVQANLTQYLKEQVFRRASVISSSLGPRVNPDSAGVPLPYIAFASGQPAGPVDTSSRYDAADQQQEQWLMSSRSTSRRETYVSHFVTRRIRIEDTSPVIAMVETDASTAAASWYGRDSVSSLGGASVDSSERDSEASGSHAGNYTGSSGAIGDNHGTFAPVNEEQVLLVVTDVHLYMLSTSFFHKAASAKKVAERRRREPQTGFSAAFRVSSRAALSHVEEPTTFGDAPVPILLARHSLRALQRAAIYFGFQRLRLDFVVGAASDTPLSRRSVVPHIPGAAHPSPADSLLDDVTDGATPSGKLSVAVEDWLRRESLLTPTSTSAPGSLSVSPSVASTMERAAAANAVGAAGGGALEEMGIASDGGDGGDVRLRSHMLICRDKKASNLLLLSILKAANARRKEIAPPLRNVQISNCDSQLLDAMQAALRARAGEGSSATKQLQNEARESKIFYQMLHQTWRNSPGVKEPRSLFILGDSLVLCEERLDSRLVRLNLLDRTRVRDVARVQTEDKDETGLKVTIVINPAAGSFKFKSRKWRLEAPSRDIARRLLDALRQVCSVQE